MFKSDLESKIKNIATVFFNDQMGIYPTFDGVKIWEDMCIVKTMNALAPAENSFVGDFMFIKQVIIKLFDEVMPILKKKIKNTTGTETSSIDFFIGNNNVQFLNITFRENVENNLCLEGEKGC